MSALADPRAQARLDALYRANAPALIGIVAGELRRPRAKVEDACQEAWAILARRPDVLDGPAPRAWLVTVAIRECLRAARRDPIPVEQLPEAVAPALDDLLEARAALRQVAELRPVRRRVFERRLAGLSYREIAAELGVTYTNVNRHITESRAELRAAA
jgi:RNA polymerase sigma factor (sigma-70 family)